MIIVSGASGIVGRAVCEALRAANLEHCGLYRPGATVDSGSTAIYHDISAGPLPKDITSRMEFFVHLAAAVPHGPVYQDTDSSAQITRSIDFHAFSSAQAAACPVVYMSSCGLYDKNDPTPKSPNLTKTLVTSPYFAAKHAGEQLFSALGNRCMIARLSAPVGPGLPERLVFSRFLNSALSGETLELWGHGKREQDFIAVQDIAQALLAMIKNPHCGIYNLARGTPTTMRELAETIVATLARGHVVFANQADPADGQTARYDISGTQSRFGWAPQYNLVDMIQSMIRSCTFQE